jgi:transcriptional regulator with XRE-family HTH domain
MASVIGLNVRRLRLDAGLTLDRVATALRTRGLAWSAGRLANLESGIHPPLAFETVLAIAFVMSETLGRTVTVAELSATHETVTLTDQLEIGGAALVMAVSGQPVAATSATFTGEGALSAVVVTEADRKVCLALGVDVATGAAAMRELWGDLFSAERDRRAGAEANAQKRGIVARHLKAELRNHLEGNTSDGNN